MNGFKLVVARRKANKRIKIALSVHESFPIGQQATDETLTLGRCVNDLAGTGVGKLDPRYPPHPHVRSPDLGANDLGRAGTQWAFTEFLKALHEGLAIAQGFLCSRIGVLFPMQTFKELVSGRDDVFDLGAGLRLEQGQRVDKHAWVGDKFRRLLQLPQGCACFDATSKNRLCLQINGRWKSGEIVVRLIRLPPH